MSIGRMFVSALASQGTVNEYLGYGPIAHLFKGAEVDVFKFVDQHVKKYGSIPKGETIEAHTKQPLMGHHEPPAYYLDLMGKRHVEIAIKKAMQDSSNLLLPENKDPDAALAKLVEVAMQLVTEKGQKQIHDFRDAYDLLIPDYVQKLTGDGAGRLMTGYPTLDDMSGGFGPGDMVSLVGRPKLGKTFFMLFMAHHGWALAQQKFELSGSPEDLVNSSRLFVSMEMKTLDIEQRLAAMHAKVMLTHLKKAELSTVGLTKLKKGLEALKQFASGFWVLDGNLASRVEDVEMYARQLKPGSIWIDGGYLMSHPTERDRFKRVAENATLIKERLCPLAPTVVSWQFAKTASKGQKKKGEKVTYDDIGYTDAIAQLSSVAMGVFEEDSVETLVRRKVEILAGRNGEVGSFQTNWDFSAKMDFSEVTEVPVGDLQYL